MAYGDQGKAKRLVPRAFAGRWPPRGPPLHVCRAKLDRCFRPAVGEYVAILAALGIAGDAEQGALMSYGPDLHDLFRRSAVYVDRILKGGKPGEIPVEQPTKLEFVVNLTTAKTLGLEIPPALLSLADDLIE